MRLLSKIWILTLIFLTVVQSVAFALLPRGLARAAFSDIVCALLMLSVLVVTSLNGISSKGRMRVFWILQATGWGLWLLDQLMWIVFDLVLKKQMPEMFSADALLFMTGVPILAGLLLRPHLQPSERSARLGALDFSLLLLWWLYLYVFYVICWQYVSPDQAHYDINYDLLDAERPWYLPLFWECSGTGPQDSGGSFTVIFLERCYSIAWRSTS